MSDIPVAVWSGSIRLFGVDVQCHRLSDGRNIIEEESMARLLEAMETGSLDVGDVESFAKFQRGLPVNGKDSCIHEFVWYGCKNGGTIQVYQCRFCNISKEVESLPVLDRAHDSAPESRK